MNSKKNGSNNTLLVLSGIVAVLLIALNIVKIKSINETTAQIKNMEAMIIDQKAHLEELTELALIRADLEKAHKILAEKIPNKPGEGKLIEYVDKLASENKAGFTRIQFEKRTVNGLMTEMPMQIMFTGNYTSFVGFIRGITEGERLIRIDGMQIDRESSDGIINASINAKAFYK